MKKKKILFISIGIVLLSSIAMIAFINQGETVEVVKARKGDIQKYIEDIGTATYKDLVNVSIEGNGLIQNVTADVGQQVKKGDKLLAMENEELKIQLKDVDEKIKELKAAYEGSGVKNYATNVEKAAIAANQAEEAYNLALKGYKDAKVLEELIEISNKNYKANVKKATIAVNQAEDAYNLASEEYEDAQVLKEAGAISSEELEQKEQALKNAEDLMKTAKLNLNQIKANKSENINAVYTAQLESQQREQALQSAKALMKTAKLDLKQSKANNTESSEAVYKAQLEQAKLSRKSMLSNIEKLEVKAPADGIILEKNAEANTMGISGTVAYVIAKADNVEIEANILADDAVNIKLGDSVEITDRSQEKKKITGKVVDIAPSAVAVTSSLGVNQKRVAIKIEPSEQLKQLKHGFEVDIRVIIEKSSNAVLVPLSSVFEYKEKDCVFVVTGKKAVIRNVEKGIQDEEFVEIKDGLKEGEIILSAPDNNVKEGMRINLKKSLNK